MKKKTIITILIIIVIAILSILFLLTGRARTDVYLEDYEISEDGKKMTLDALVLNSSGYIRKMKRTSGSMNYYLTFYSTFGINSKRGAKNKFEIDLDPSVTEIYFYNGDGGYRKVLEKDVETGEWYKPNEVISKSDGISTEIYDISLTGATIIIKDKNKDNLYGEWYKIERYENGKWKEVPTIIKNHAFTSIAYHLNEFNEIKFVIDWEWLYGELPLGSYRIVKDVNHKYIYIPFEIANTYE